MTVKSSISLTDEQDAFARSLVRSGRYASVSAVVQQGLDLLRRKTESEEAETAALRQLLKKRLQGDFVSGDEMDERISAIVKRKRRDYGVPG
jgi:antitoxin ParD1/3/4